MYQYNVKIRTVPTGRVSIITVHATNASHARELVMSQYGSSIVILRIDRGR